MNAKYCTFKCELQYEKITRNCKFCEKEFIPTNRINKYCSPECCKANFMETYEATYETSRFTIFKRDDFRCVYCGDSPVDTKTELHVDHVFPRNSGGGNDLYNLVTSCQRCNLEKSSRPLSKEQTLQIWERNQRLNQELGILDYQELKESFEKVWKTV